MLLRGSGGLGLRWMAWSSGQVRGDCILAFRHDFEEVTVPRAVQLDLLRSFLLTFQPVYGLDAEPYTMPSLSALRPSHADRCGQRRVQVDVPDARSDKHELLSGSDLPVLGRRVPVADVAPRQVKGHGFGLTRLQFDLVKAAEDSPGVVVAAQLDVLLLVRVGISGGGIHGLPVAESQSPSLRLCS